MEKKVVWVCTFVGCGYVSDSPLKDKTGRPRCPRCGTYLTRMKESKLLERLRQEDSLIWTGEPSL